MKHTLLLITLTSLLAFGCATVDTTKSDTAGHTADHTKSQTRADPYSDFIYQYSIIDALLAGVYDGELSLGELKERGDFGIGTFNRLDGELLMIDGVVYKLAYDGTIFAAPDSEGTPLAFVKSFKADNKIVMEGKDLTLEDVVKKLEQVLSGNSLYAVKISGEFKTMNARSVKAADKPYPSLAEHVAAGGQYVFNFEDTAGVCVGFVMPPYVARTNVPGIHLHYLANDHKAGGHVFNFTADRLEIEIDEAEGLIVQRNTDSSFKAADLDRDRKQELHKVETKN